MKTKLFLTGLALAAMVTIASAQVGNGNGSGDGVCDGTCENFVDANNDGICDNYAEGNQTGNGLRRGLAGNGTNAVAEGLGQAFRHGQTAATGRTFGFVQGRGPASEGRHLYGPGYRVNSEE